MLPVGSVVKGSTAAHCGMVMRIPSPFVSYWGRPARPIHLEDQAAQAPPIDPSLGCRSIREQKEIHLILRKHSHDTFLTQSSSITMLLSSTGIICNELHPSEALYSWHKKGQFTSPPPPRSRYHIAETNTCVPLMMTVWAGRLTPQASVAVETRTWMWRSAKRSSTSVLSSLDMPAWCMAKP